MKNIRTYGLTTLMMAAAVGFGSCSDEFLKEKTLYGSFGAETVYENYDTAEGRVDYLYSILLPKTPGGSNALTDIVSAGNNDDFSQCTEEYGGLSIFNDPNAVLTIETVPDYFYVINASTSPYGRIRECNDVIEGITGSESLSQEQKETLLGQAYFMRAWRYYLLVKLYGGVPIIDQVQNPIIGDSGGEHLIVPRSSTKDCIDFICNDLDLAAQYLPNQWTGNDYGRVTSGAALALKGRLLLLYASPLFNRSDDHTRWENAYQANLAAINELNAGGRGLAYSADGGENNARNWGRMFASYTGESEAVFVTLYNNVAPVDGQDVHEYNLWEDGIRPANINGGGGRRATSEMVDLFPMADGKRPGRSIYPYDSEKFFMNRDPRFYRTFAFPGVEWKFNSGNVDFSANSMSSLCPSRYTSGANYELWNYCWYSTAEDRDNESHSGFAADMLGTGNTGIYVRKRTNDDPESGLMVFSDLASGEAHGFRRSAACYMEIRYAEVLLNLAESACGAEHFPEALSALQQVRARVGYTEANNYGLETGIENNRQGLFSAILYERQIEFAYEGKRFDDMRRWMLFDGGVGQSALSPSWALSGFGGNTCTYLGETPMNDRGKRHRIEIYINETAPEANNSDPLANVTRPAALTLNEDMTTRDGESESDNMTFNDETGRVSALYDFYTTYFHRKDIDVDGNEANNVPTFRPEYYFLGLRQSAQQTNVTLLQTIGWNDFSHGGMGTFDPLAE